jgi:hypothetical protein
MRFELVSVPGDERVNFEYAKSRLRAAGMVTADERGGWCVLATDNTALLLATVLPYLTAYLLLIRILSRDQITSQTHLIDEFKKVIAEVRHM